jgi:CheY-like chemotaxis protein
VKQLVELHGGTIEITSAGEGKGTTCKVVLPLQPGEDGYTLLKEVRLASGAANSARIPALALTAFARPDDRRRALEAGFDEHLAKPVDAEQLLAVVAQLTQKKS